MWRSYKVKRRYVGFIVGMLFLFCPVHAQTIIPVGSAETYKTIATAYAACTNASTNYILELRTTYTNNEAKPIVLGSNTALSITIRPQSGVASLTLGLVSGTETSIFSFTGGDNVTIDGRAGGSGAGVLTIENTQNAASRYAIQFTGGSTGNTIKYCTIKGSNTSSTAASTAPGIILFGSGTNSGNTIDNCTIQQSGTNYPAVCINSYDATNNNQIAVSNCNLVNFTYYGVWANGSNNNSWTISGNSFYSDRVQSGWTNAVYMIHLSDGTGYSITGNYFGGRAALCGGSAYTLSTSSSLFPIYIADCDAGTITISGNYIQNIALTSTLAGNQWAPFYIAAGSANFTIGSSGAGNTIGATSGTGNIVCTDNAVNTSSVAQYVAGSILSTGTSTIQYNSIGAVILNGSNVNTGKKVYGIFLDKGTLTFSNNTMGNTTNNNIYLNPNSGAIIYLVNIASTCTGITTVSNNSFRNIQNNAVAGDFAVIYGLNQLTCNANTFSGISSASSYTPDQAIISFKVAEALVITNSIFKAITFTHANSQANIVYVDNTSATVNFSNNTIGEAGVTNDITFSGNDLNRAVYFDDCGDITCSNNIVQNLYCNSTGTASRLIAFYTDSNSDGTNTYSDNTINNLTCDGTGTAAFNGNYYLIAGFYLSGDGTNTFTHNTISNLAGTTTSSTADLWVIGMVFPTPSGNITVEKNRITGLTHKGTIGTTAVKIVGIRTTADGNTNYYNNVIILDNGSNTNYMPIEGFFIVPTSGTGTHNFYHNTVKIAGTTSGTAIRNAWYTTATTGTYNLRNNIFQTISTGGTGARYAIQKTTAGITWTETNNYLEASTIGNWNGTSKTALSDWQGVSGTNDKTGSITIAPVGTVPAATTSDVKNTGFDADALVATDIDGVSRHPSTPFMGAYEGVSALPVELLEFKAVASSQSVLLNWITLSEKNNDYFTIERSADGKTFLPVSTKKGAGNSCKLLSYEDRDDSPLNGTSYYRLKQTDFNSAVSISPIVSVSFSSLNNVAVFPNPALDQIHLLFSSSIKDDYEVKIFNTKGILVKTVKETAVEGNNSLSIDLSVLSKGLYFISLSGSFGILKTQLIKK